MDPSRLPRWTWTDLEIGDELGRGAMGVVLDATVVLTGDRVAVKVLEADEEIRTIAAEYFLREVEISSQLEHPHIVRFLGVGEGPRGPFLVMEFVAGGSLRERLDLGGPMAVSDVVEIGQQILAALAHAHERELVHRDVKPENIMISDTSDGLFARLVDFGLARAYVGSPHRTLTATGEPRGTLHYAAAECVHDARTAQPAADVFSAGATLYSALTNAAPYEDGLTYAELLDAIASGAIVPLRSRRSDVSPRLAATIERALRLDPRHRWPDAATMARHLLT